MLIASIQERRDGGLKQAVTRTREGGGRMAFPRGQDAREKLGRGRAMKNRRVKSDLNQERDPARLQGGQLVVEKGVLIAVTFRESG